MIPYGRQDITQSDIDAVAEMLKSDFLTQGPKVLLFEQTVAAKVGARHALATNNHWLSVPPSSPTSNFIFEQEDLMS